MKPILSPTLFAAFLSTASAPPAKTVLAPAPKIVKSTTVPVAKPQDGRPKYFNVMFSDTDVAEVLQALSARTGANVVYAGKPGNTISLNVRVDGPEGAIRSVAAAGGLAYRKVGNVFVVAPPGGMRQALEPYGATVSTTVPPESRGDVIASLNAALPYVDAKLLGNRLVLTGIPEDLARAEAYVADLRRNAEAAAVVSDAYTVAHGSAADLVKVVSSVYPSVKAAASAGQGGVIALSGNAADLAGAKQLLARLDVAGSQAEEIVTRVYELQYTSADVLAEFLKKGAPSVETMVGPGPAAPPRPQFSPLSATLGSAITGGGAGGLGIGGFGQGGFGVPAGQDPRGNVDSRIADSSERARALVLRGPAAAVETALNLIRQLDVKPLQVIVEVRVVETSKTFAENLGVEYNWTPFRFVETAPGSTVSGNPFGSGSAVTRPAGLGQFSRVPWNLIANLNALVRDGKAKVLANPSVQVIDNQDANIFIGDTIRARVAQATALGAQTVDIREFPIGIVLLIRPRISPDGNITMRVNPVVSTVTAIGPDNVPQTSSREAETTVIVRDGETIAIGGLIRDEQSTVVSRVPILSQLPIVGELFKSRSTNKIRTDVVVTITPRIVRDVATDTAAPAQGGSK